LSGLSTLFTWGSICLCHIRFRAAWKAQGHDVRELPFKAMGGVWGSYFGVILIVLVIAAQFYVAIWPIGGMSEDPAEVAQDFFKTFLAVPIVIAFSIGGYVWKRSTPRKAHEIDIDVSRRRARPYTLLRNTDADWYCALETDRKEELAYRRANG
jgi:amino acid transporter